MPGEVGSKGIAVPMVGATAYSAAKGFKGGG